MQLQADRTYALRQCFMQEFACLSVTRQGWTSCQWPTRSPYHSRWHIVDIVPICAIRPILNQQRFVGSPSSPHSMRSLLRFLLPV
jgi:hypothetical protein